MQDLFEEKAKTWDKGDVQTSTAHAIAVAIKNTIELNKNMDILDFGVGTGLLGFEIAKEVKKVHGVDISAKMLEKLEQKNTSQLSITPYCQDIIKNPLNMKFDGLISSMALHHIENLKGFFNTIYKNINAKGFIAIADLEKEDGTFHSDNTGVFHFGFDEEELYNVVKECGFSDISFKRITKIEKPQKEFGIFLMTAIKQ